MSPENHLPQTQVSRALRTCGICLAAVLAVACSSESEPQQPAATMTVTLRTLETVQLARNLNANGTIYPWQEIIVGAEVGGYRVSAVNVDVGDQREASGEELVRLAALTCLPPMSHRNARTCSRRKPRSRMSQLLIVAPPRSSVEAALSQSDVDQAAQRRLAAQARLEVAKADLEAAELRLAIRASLRPMTASSPRVPSPSVRLHRPAARCCAWSAKGVSNGAQRFPRRASAR